MLKGGEFWPSRCPACGKLEVDFIAPGNWVEGGAARVLPFSAPGAERSRKIR